MINPDNTLYSKNSNPKGIEKVEGRSDKALVYRKDRKTEGVYERKKTKEELAKEWEEVKEKSDNDEKPIVESEGGKEEVEKPVSLFDLAKEKPIRIQPHTLEDKLELISKADAKTLKKGSLFDLASEKTDRKDNPKTSPKTTYKPETPDLSHVNLLATETPLLNKDILPVEKAPPRSEAVALQKIVDEIVEHVYQLEKSGETSLIIVINDPKNLFHKSSIKVTEFDMAKGQLNITIDNLSNEAKTLIDKQQGALLTALELKGYQVHQFIATSVVENPRIYAENSGSRKSGEESPKKGSERENEHESNKEQQK